ncbi:MAG: DUF116 domain-containing protein [Candidatus Parvarchaeota archaeon]|nr:DUF116 domain-containing protein [Candidatus Jingweiarchaeum tengchongense]MCW1298016.1 DUF116 domain-containing protein [Candidatus Jingweiarchaeum tengchongense]MCW1300184.1 DUF116 domain-containing protein [Candidatus Jingweiarchaeum tengchongense]MCW1304394.1 DUF116 domain-containing protein [Candidatus Jingweiarchaeum tengchongense]MCW1310946.1 DUF116 domain-containing protein [Candidatus Jingweiarchaeum tengchongense]
MPYKFNFDISGFPKDFFRDITKKVVNFIDEKDLTSKIENLATKIVKKFKVDEMTGLNLSNSITVVSDLIEIQIKNLKNRAKFEETGKRALFLPHCARKYMDNRCKAYFDPNVPSYYCKNCSPDCLISESTTLGRSKGYDVYVLPGGSCIPKILEKYHYNGIVGVACPEELKLGYSYLEKLSVPGQGVFLTKNGCSNTKFDIKTLKEIL